MKTLLTTFVAALVLLLAIPAAAQTPSVADFALDAGTTFDRLDALEEAIGNVPANTNADEWMMQLAATLPDSLDGEYRDPLLNLKPFTFAAVAGCAGSCIGLGWAAGIAAVVIVNQDAPKAIRRYQTGKAWLGCAAGNAPYVVFLAAYITAIVLANGGEF